MKKNILIIAISFIAISFTACNSEKSQSAVSKCPDLDQLFSQMDRIEMTLEAEPFEVDGSEALLDSIESGLKANLASGKTDCSFLNQQAHPKKVRFEFIEPLTARTLEKKLTSGLSRLFSLSQLFKSDKEISEYLGEELAEIASANPQLYNDYYANLGDSKELLLKATRWVVTDKNKLASSFSAMAGGEELVRFLQSQ